MKSVGRGLFSLMKSHFISRHSIYRERVEIESLKQSIMSLQEETKRQSSRWQMSQDRMKKRIDSLQKRNGELEDEVRVLEVSRAGFIEEKKTLEVSSDSRGKTLYDV